MGMTIYVYSHSFVVSTVERKYKWIVAAFIRSRLTVEKFKIGKGEAEKQIFASQDPSKTKTFMHINLFDKFKQLLISEGIREIEYEIIYQRAPKGASVDIKFIAPFAMSDLQNECLDFVKEGGVATVAPLQTGKGKTALALFFMCYYGRRTLITMPAKYIERWVQDLVGDEAKVDLMDSDLVVVRGLIQLKKYIKLAKDKELPDFKVMVISNTTLYLFFKEYSKSPADWKKLGLKVPQDIFTLFKIGLRIRDEAHEDIHFICKYDGFTNVSKSIDLSATLIFDNPALERISQMVFPILNRFNQGKWDTYTDVYSVMYGLGLPTKIKWTMGFNGPYNHNEFEKSILKSKLYLHRFIIMVEGLTRTLFVDSYIPGTKLLIYASTKEMCTLLSAYLSEELPEFIVKRYIGEDDYEELLNGDITVTTPKSAGTGVDIPRLAMIIDTVNTSSTQANVQKIGRLRKLSLTDEDGNVITPRYYYTTCVNIPHHMRYHIEKQSKLKGFVKSLQTYDTAYRL